MNVLNLCNCVVVTFFLNSFVSSAKIDCEPVKKCSFVRNILSRRYIQPSPEVWSLFKISKCGYDEETRNLKIWCPQFKTCRTVDDNIGKCIPKNVCTELGFFSTVNPITELKVASDASDCDGSENFEICCPWPVDFNTEVVHSPNLGKKKYTERKKRNTNYPWSGYNNNGNNIFGGGQNQFYQLNKGFGSDGFNLNLGNFGHGSDANLFPNQNTNFYHQLQNSLQKQTTFLEVGLQNTSKNLSDSQRNFTNQLMNSLNWFPGKTDYSKYNLTEETSVSTREHCLTPDNFEGICKQFRQCQTFMKALNDVDNTGSVQIEYLKKFRCNSTESGDDNATVCCTKNSIVLPDAASRTVESKTKTQGSTVNPLDSLADICGLQSLDDKIIGGSTTGLSEFPWTAVLYYNTAKGLTFGCGGTVITNRYIVTAAHCVDQNILRQAGYQNLQKVVLGEYDRRNDTDCIYTPFGSDCADPPQSFGVAEIFEHEKFRSDATPDDIALILLDRNITFNDFVRPICLPTTSSLNLNGNEVFTIAGWGRTESGESSQVKRKARLPFISKVNCSQLGPLADGQMCLGSGKGTDSCKGDSGGPVMLLTNRESRVAVTTLVGIISFGFGRCGSTTSVSTYVPFYMDWILKNIS